MKVAVEEVIERLACKGRDPASPMPYRVTTPQALAGADVLCDWRWWLGVALHHRQVGGIKKHRRARTHPQTKLERPPLVGHQFETWGNGNLSNLAPPLPASASEE